MIERAVTDLPEPDSPTTPTTVLRGMVKSTPSIALIGPASVTNETLRPLMSTRLSPIDPVRSNSSLIVDHSLALIRHVFVHHGRLRILRHEVFVHVLTQIGRLLGGIFDGRVLLFHNGL